MTEPAGRISPATDFELWQTLYAQWVGEGKPAYIVTGSLNQTWRRVQLTSGSDAFDPMSREELSASTSFPKG
jgi:hypothetical protein